MRLVVRACHLAANTEEVRFSSLPETMSRLPFGKPCSAPVVTPRAWSAPGFTAYGFLTENHVRLYVLPLDPGRLGEAAAEKHGIHRVVLGSARRLLMALLPACVRVRRFDLSRPRARADAVYLATRHHVLS